MSAILGATGCATQQDLYDAAAIGDNVESRNLEAAGINPYLKNEQGLSPIDAAIDRAKYSQTSHAWVDEKLRESRDEASEALAAIDSETMSAAQFRSLLDKHSFYLDVALDSNGERILHWLTLRNLTDYIEVAIDVGSDVNVQNDRGNTPLHASTLRGNERAVSMLIDAGAKVNVENARGLTAIFMPIFIETEDFDTGISGSAELIANAGGDLNYVNNTGRTPLAAAVFNNAVNYRDVLIDLGADIDAHNENA